MTDLGHSAHETDVIVVTYNSAEYLARLAGSLRAVQGIATITVADNDSTDGSVRVARSLNWGAPCEVMEMPSNLGFGAAMNIAARRAKVRNPDGTELLVINPDVELHGDALAVLRCDLGADKRAAVAGLSLRTSSGEPVSSARAFPTPKMIAFRKVRDEKLQDGPSHVEWLCGALMLWRRIAFDALGGFDSEYFLYYEDVDICRRAWNEGWRVVADGSVTAVHDQGHGKATPPALRRINRESRRAYAAKWYGWKGRVAAAVADITDAAAGVYHKLVRR